jgi:hypothetical protein
MNKLPDVCKDCAEYGSEFCNDCLDEINQNLSTEDKVLLSRALQNIVKTLNSKNKNSD